MKNRFRSLFAVFFSLVLLLSCTVSASYAGNEVTVDVSAKFLYDEARSMLNYINDFRTGDEAYYVNSDNRTQTRVTGLQKLQYDYNLEATAMLRALELAVYFSHTRPNGQQWSSAHTGTYTRGENICYGYGSAKSAFKAFREDDEDYAGQGHRRIMLEKKFTRAGFGCVKVGGTVYWAEEFGSGAAGGSASQKFSANSVSAIWEILNAGRTKISASASDLTITAGESIDLPKVILTSGSGAKNVLHQTKWSSSNKKVAKIKNSKLVAVKKGKTNLTIDVNGTTLKVKVKVVKESGKTSASLESLEDYTTPLGTEDTEIFIVDEEGAAFMDESDLPETDE